MKERLLVLAKAAPVQSSKYRYLVCVAGITESGEWRRVYPVPWEVFSGKSKNKFMKKQWIEYELVEDKSPDGRPESRKIKKHSIVPLHHENYKSIKKMLEDKLTNMEILQNKKRQECSLGVVKPSIIKDIVWMDREVLSNDDTKVQLTLDGTEVINLEPLDKKFQYHFKCSSTCPTEHKIMCEDWKIEELYRKLKKKYNVDKACNLVKNKFLNEIYYKDHTYFIVGTHHRWNTWLIVSVVYPKKKDLNVLAMKSLDEFM